MEGLFLANEEGTKVLSIFNDVKSGALSYKNAKDQVLDSKPPSSSSSSSNKTNEKNKASATTVDLLTSTRDDFLGRAVPFSSPSVATTTTTALPSASTLPANGSNNFNAFDNWMAFDSNDNNSSSSSSNPVTAMSSPPKKSTEPTTATATPATKSMVQYVCDIIQQVRGYRPKAHSSFAAISLDSLGAVLFLRVLSDSLGGVRIPPSSVYGPGITISSFAEALAVRLLKENPAIFELKGIDPYSNSAVAVDSGVKTRRQMQGIQ